MRRIGIAYFTERGHALALRLAEALGDSCEFLWYEKELKQWCARCFAEAEALIFIGAAGIAVRTIAPFRKGKTQDPAVLVLDEAGAYVISLLSGHIGGANELALETAALLGAQPVITTASDVRGLPAVDVFAKKNGLAIESMQAAKQLAAALLRGDPVGVFCSGTVDGALPPGFFAAETGRWQYLLWISERRMMQEEKRRYLAGEQAVVLSLIPRAVTLGVGCRRGKEAEPILQAVRRALADAQICKEALAGAASIDLKKKEQGILRACERLGVPFVTYTAQELAAVKGSFSPSEFVKKTTGVDNVCERAALALAGNSGRLEVGKQAENGVTVALAVREWRISFEK